MFEPVLDQLGVEFQYVVNHVSDIREKYFSRIQVENSKNILKQLDSSNSGLGKGTELSLADIEKFKFLLNNPQSLVK